MHWSLGWLLLGCLLKSLSRSSKGLSVFFSIDSWEVFIDSRHGSSLHIWIGLPFSLLENVFFDGQMFAANVVELIFVVCTLCVTIRIALPVA